MFLVPFDVVRVSSVVSLQLLVYVEQDDHRGDEIHRFSCGEQVKVGATVSTAVSVAENLKGQGGKLSIFLLPVVQVGTFVLHYYTVLSKVS